MVIMMKFCFKPYYKWTAFNTAIKKNVEREYDSFKPYYNWNAFNTLKRDC